MSGPKRNPDKLNTIGVVVVGICGAVLVYVSITALQAFYMKDTSEIQTMADYGGQDQTARGKKADELRNISEPGVNQGGVGTYRMKIEDAFKLVVEDAKTTPEHVTGSKLPPATKESIPPAFGRPRLGGAAPAPADGAGAGSAAPAGAGSAAAPAGAGSATGASAPNPGAAGSAAPMTPTGTGPGGAGASPGTGAAAGSGAATR